EGHLLAVHDDEGQGGAQQAPDVTVIVYRLDDQFAGLQLVAHGVEQFGERARFGHLAALLRHVLDVARYVTASHQQGHLTAEGCGDRHAEGPDDGLASERLQADVDDGVTACWYRRLLENQVGHGGVVLLGAQVDAEVDARNGRRLEGVGRQQRQRTSRQPGAVERDVAGAADLLQHVESPGGSQRDLPGKVGVAGTGHAQRPVDELERGDRGQGRVEPLVGREAELEDLVGGAGADGDGQRQRVRSRAGDAGERGGRVEDDGAEAARADVG